MTTVTDILLPAVWRSLSTVQAATWIALTGWFVTGIGWYVSQRAQRRVFVYQARNAARAEIVTALRKQQHLLGKLSNLALTISTTHELGQLAGWGQQQWLDVFNQFRDTFPLTDSQWVFTLEHYEVLFPETAHCRRQMVQRNIALFQEVHEFFVALLRPNTREAAMLQAQSLFQRLGDQTALLEDLLVHVQNATLGEVVGRRVAFRQPTDPTLPRVVIRAGLLEIVEGEQ